MSFKLRPQRQGHDERAVWNSFLLSFQTGTWNHKETFSENRRAHLVGRDGAKCSSVNFQFLLFIKLQSLEWSRSLVYLVLSVFPVCSSCCVYVFVLQCSLPLCSVQVLLTPRLVVSCFTLIWCLLWTCFISCITGLLSISIVLSSSFVFDVSAVSVAVCVQVWLVVCNSLWLNFIKLLKCVSATQSWTARLLTVA